MFNHNRGLWGYTGVAADGAPLTVQSTGMGGPSAAIVIAELTDLGARRMIRTGTCGALGARGRIAADSELTEALLAEGLTSGPVVSTDLFYDGPDDEQQRWIAAG